MKSIIISGAPRSGTSMLYNLFDAHPQVNWLVTEGCFWEYLYELSPERRQNFATAFPTSVPAMIDGLRARDAMPPLHTKYKQLVEAGAAYDFVLDIEWSEARFEAFLADAPKPNNVSDLWDIVWGACLAGLGEAPRDAVCLKNPDYGMSLDSAITCLDDVCPILITRHPLFSLDSLKMARQRGNRKVLNWIDFATIAHRFEAMVDLVERHPAIRVVQYETLTKNVEGTMKDLASAVGIEYRSTLTEPTMFGREWPGISSFKETSGVETHPVDREIQCLSADEIDFLNGATRRFQDAFGYA